MNKLGLFYSTIFILLPSLLNGFPFVYFDSAFFLFYANNLYSEPAFIFRPLTYSAILALSHSTIFVVVLQSIFLNALIFKTAEILGLSRRAHLAAIFLSILLTPLAIYSNFVLTDVFIALQFLALFNCLNTAGGRLWRIFYGCIFIVCSVAHFSNFILSVVVLLIGLFLNARRKLAILLFLPIVILPLIHFAAWEKFTYTNSAYFFLFSRMTALQVSQDYLAEECQIEELKLCAVSDGGFDPWDWSSKGTLAKFSSQAELQAELKKTTLEILSRPRLLAKFAKNSAINWGKQFILFSKLPENSIDDLVLQQNLFEFNKLEFRLFSSQNFKALDQPARDSLVKILGHIYFYFVLISLGVLGLLYRSLSKMQLQFFLFLLLALVMNSFVCGVLTEPADRYQGRLIFLFPTFLIYIIVDRLIKRITGRDSRRATMS